MKNFISFICVKRTYFSLDVQEITYDYINQDMLGPEGFDERNHFHYKIYEHQTMIAYYRLYAWLSFFYET